jgi:hypothetical protein
MILTANILMDILMDVLVRRPRVAGVEGVDAVQTQAGAHLPMVE